MVMLENSLRYESDLEISKNLFICPGIISFCRSSVHYPVDILFSSVLCVFSVFLFGCLFVVSGLNPAGILCLSVKRSFNVRFMRGVYVQVPIYGLNNV